MSKWPAYKPPSLKWELIGIVLVCFVLPVILFAVSTVALMSENSERQALQTAVYNFDSAVRSAQINLQNAIAVSRAASYDPTIRRAYGAYSASGDAIALYGEVQGFLSRQYSYDPNIRATMLFFTADPFAQKDAADKIYLVTNGSGSSFSDMFRVYRNEVHGIMRGLSGEIGTGIRFVEHDGSLYLARNIVGSDYEPYAMIVMLLDTAHVFSGIANMAWETESSITLHGAEINLGGGGVTAGGVFGEATRYAASMNDFILWKQNSLEGAPVLFASRLSNMPLNGQAPASLHMLLLALLFTVLLMALFIAFFYRNITKPVKALTDAATIVQGGALGHQMEAGLHSSEFNLLASSFNRMSMRLKAMFEQTEKEQLALQDARIGALQSQINPHFLNNTLEIINWEARMAGADRVSSMIEALSTLLSGAMARNGEALVPISEELQYLDSYLMILSARLGKRLDIQKEVDAAQLSILVPRLILQPLVENAVEHGVVPNGAGRIILRVYGDGNSVILEVENDAPLSAESEAAIHRLLAGSDESNAGKLGIRNVNERVQLMYGKLSSLTIISESGRTVARLKLANPGNGPL